MGQEGLAQKRAVLVEVVAGPASVRLGEGIKVISEVEVVLQVEMREAVQPEAEEAEVPGVTLE